MNLICQKEILIVAYFLLENINLLARFVVHCLYNFYLYVLTSISQRTPGTETGGKMAMADEKLHNFINVYLSLK